MENKEDFLKGYETLERVVIEQILLLLEGEVDCADVQRVRERVNILEFLVKERSSLGSVITVNKDINVNGK